jgi:hypothetical protein
MTFSVSFGPLFRGWVSENKSGWTVALGAGLASYQSA